ncbi:F-box protein PP2-A13-like protein [Tanacetum coccineum]
MSHPSSNPPSRYRTTGAREFWVDKRTGGVCLSIGSKALSITGIDDQRYWNYIPTNESSGKGFVTIITQVAIPTSLKREGSTRFELVDKSHKAMVHLSNSSSFEQIWWLEVEGDVDFQFPAGTYSLLFKLWLRKFTRRPGRRLSNQEGVLELLD